MHRKDLPPGLKPTIKTAYPFTIHLEKDKVYFYCTCGKSDSQPFCDGSHKGTEFKPLKISLKRDVKWQLICGCKHNAISVF
jgi:CDGSH-type Zn-finger protein